LEWASPGEIRGYFFHGAKKKKLKRFHFLFHQVIQLTQQVPALPPLCFIKFILKISAMKNHYDVIIIGTGTGGGTIAYKLAQSGKKILVLERGNFIPKEKENWIRMKS